jgi:hypothetical protein
MFWGFKQAEDELNDHIVAMNIFELGFCVCDYCIFFHCAHGYSMKTSNELRIIYKGSMLRHDDKFKRSKLYQVGHIKILEPYIC